VGYVGAWAGAVGGYPRQQLPWEVQDDRLDVVVDTRSLSALTMSKQPPGQRWPHPPSTSLHHAVVLQLINLIDVALAEVVVH
jgi:hypothetical protein